MRRLHVSVAAMIVAFVSMPALAQNRQLSPEMQADTEALRARSLRPARCYQSTGLPCRCIPP
jgi:hypothetical protein